jgi:hypothetical protein
MVSKLSVPTLQSILAFLASTSPEARAAIETSYVRELQSQLQDATRQNQQDEQ